MKIYKAVTVTCQDGVQIMVGNVSCGEVSAAPTTPEMIAAFAQSSQQYAAMDAVAPVPLASEAEDRIAALEAEVITLHDALKVRTDERDEALRDHQIYENEIVFLRRVANERPALYEVRALLDAKDARIAELDSLLAQRPEAVPDTPSPAHDAFRDFNGDRRRMGP